MRQRLAELIDILYGFKKFIAFLLLLGISILFRLKSLIDGGQFVDLMKSVSVAFFAVNGVEHFTEAARSYFNGKIPGGLPTAPSAPAHPDYSGEK
jgi:hypothetical protein